MQQWWQKKLSLFAGIGGAFILIQQSILAGIIWPVYTVLSDPLAILTASDAPYRGVFITLQLVAMALMLISLVAIIMQYRARRNSTFENALVRVLIAFSVYMGLIMVTQQSMATVALKPGFTLLHVIDAVAIAFVIYTLWNYSQIAFNDDQISLGNAVQLLAILFGLFHFLEFGVGMLGLPLRGFFDVLALDSFAAAIGFICWYYGRKTAI